MPPLPRFYRRQQQVADTQRLAKILLEVGEDEPPAQAAGVTSGGDWARLRGLPAIGRGCSGAIPGTNPLAALIAKENRNPRSRR